MNILKNYFNKTAKVVFGSKISRDTIERKAYISYSFVVSRDLAKTLNIGDYVVVECAKGLEVAVFIGFSNSIVDKKRAYRPIVCKIADYTIDTKM